MEEYTPEVAPAAPEENQTPAEVAPAAPEEKQPSAWGRVILDVIETLLLAVVLFFAINAVSARVRVDGFSMMPSLQNGEYVLVNKLAYKFGEPQRGDIVVFRFPLNPSEDLIKRIIGLPGDIIKVENGNVFVNGNQIEEPYIAAAPEYNGEWAVEDGKLFVLGDNRNDSSDSHAWGVLPKENIIGKALVIYWPPQNWEFLDTKVAIAAP